MLAVDLNADLGEGFGAYRLGDDEALLEVVTSANVACGFHAGDPRVMERTVRLAAARGVAVGAHVGYPDRVGFGRRAIAASPDEVRTDTLYQLGALEAFCRAAGVRLQHVKPHGALYNQAAADRALAEAIAEAVRAFDPELILVAPVGSELERAGLQAGLRVAREGFPDRGYAPDGRLQPRGRPGAVVEDPAEVARRALRMVREGCVEAVDGSVLPIRVETLCIHGDRPGAAEVARAVRRALEEAGVEVVPLARVLETG